MKTIIIGGVAGGASAAARLRRLDEKAEIILLERGEYISYANCGLPYYIGGEITDQAALTLQTPQSFYARFHIDVRTESAAEAIDPAGKTVTVRSLSTGEVYVESYDTLILSPGAEPIRPAWTAIDDPRVFTLRNIPDTLKIKAHIDTGNAKSALIVGGGYIGVEMAENLKNAGLAVTIVELSDHLIAPLDYEMACDVHHYLRTQGVTLRLNTGVQDLKSGTQGVEAQLQSGEILSADMVLLSIGVRPDSALARDAGLAVNARGAIVVNEHMQTADDHIYAVGDAVEIQNLVTGQPGYIPLAGPANKQGRIAADHICGIASAFRGTQGSAIAKLFDMTIASTGLSEAAATAAGLDCDKVYAYTASHATYFPGASNLCIKLLFEKQDGRLLGAQLVGFDGVDKRCDVLAAAIRGHMTVYDLTELELCYAPPFSSAKDPVNMAGFVAENVLTGKVRQYFWQDVAPLRERTDIVMLDVRTAGEYAQGHIEGTVHIPLDTLRENLERLDKTKPLYVNCQSGLRSYLACRILTQNGFTCYNLAGGWRLYESATREIAFDQAPRHACGVKV